MQVACPFHAKSVATGCTKTRIVPRDGAGPFAGNVQEVLLTLKHWANQLLTTTGGGNTLASHVSLVSIRRQPPSKPRRLQRSVLQDLSSLMMPWMPVAPRLTLLRLLLQLRTRRRPQVAQILRSRAIRAVLPPPPGQPAPAPAPTPVLPRDRPRPLPIRLGRREST